jgi:hypothetical protein
MYSKIKAAKLNEQDGRLKSVVICRSVRGTLGEVLYNCGSVHLVFCALRSVARVDNRGICIYVCNTTEVVKTNYILVNAWRHVSAVLKAIFRPTCSTDQVYCTTHVNVMVSHIVRTLFVPDLYYKLA